MTFDPVAIRAWQRRQERARRAYENVTPCSECGVDNRDGRSVCAACKQAAYRARQKHRGEKP